MKILQLNTSVKASGSVSSELADALRDRLLSQYPQAEVVLRDFARDPLAELDAAALAALGTPEAQRTPEQAARVAVDDRLIAEVQAADVLVIGMPMYNFGIPAQFKNWIDAVCRARVTFRYTEQGPEGLLTGKRVFFLLARGGQYRDTALDSQVPYLQTVFGFLGMTDLTFIYAEGQAQEAVGEQSRAAARAQIAELAL